MRQFAAFVKKEWMEQIRSKKGCILLVIFILFGILSPALAKITPWLYETMADEMAQQGIVIRQLEVNALTSWQQYYKNISLMLLIFVVMSGGVMAGEYQKGTWIPILTKGMPRFKVLTAKLAIVLSAWTVCHWASYGITYGYNAYFWDNSVVKTPGFASFCIYILGIWLIFAMMLGAVCLENQAAVLLFTGGVALVFYVLGMVPILSKYMPVKLMGAAELLTGAIKPEVMMKPLVVSVICMAVFGTGAVLAFQRKRL